MGLDIVGPTEIADLLGVHRVTVDRWRRDGDLPPPDAVLARGPVWRTSRILAWAENTNRPVVSSGHE